MTVTHLATRQFIGRQPYAVTSGDYPSTCIVFVFDSESEPVQLGVLRPGTMMCDLCGLRCIHVDAVAAFRNVEQPQLPEMLT